MPPHDDGLRSLRCCKRRSVVSDLRRFGHKWSSSRLRIAIIHASPIRSDPYAAFSPTPSSSDIALAAAAGLSLQGHSVTLYTSGYRQKDVPDYLWDTSAEIKTCLPRLARLALFSARRESRCAFQIVSVLVSLRVMLSCMVSFFANQLWSLLPQVVQRARAHSHHRITSFSRGCLDVVLCFETSIPTILLSPLVHDMIYYSTTKRIDFHLNKRVHILTPADSVMAATTIYAPVVVRSCPLTPTNRREENPMPTGSPYFVALAWYENVSDIYMVIESFATFLSYHQPRFPGEVSDEDDGCTGSTTILATPSLVIAGVHEDHYLLILREANRFKLTESVDFTILHQDASLNVLLANSLGLIHTPGEVNESRIPCAAMLAGRPVITTISFSAIEPVRHEATGIVVKTRSVHLIAQAIDSLFRLYLTRPNEWARMGARGKQRVLTEFSIEMFGSRLDDFLDSSHSPALVTPPVRRVSYHAGLSELISHED